MTLSLTRNFLVYSFAAMLALGNVDINVSYLGAIPFGLVITWLSGKAAASSQ